MVDVLIQSHHGSVKRYRAYKCRCDVCVNGQRTRARAQYRRTQLRKSPSKTFRTSPLSPTQHGEIRCYKLGCTCDLCLEANNARNRRQRSRENLTPAAQETVKRRHEQHIKRVKRSIQLINELKAVPCMDCDIKYPYYVMHFDHRDPHKKCYNVGRMKGYSTLSIRAEAAKCDVVCANCHAERTFVAGAYTARYPKRPLIRRY